MWDFRAHHLRGTLGATDTCSPQLNSLPHCVSIAELSRRVRFRFITEPIRFNGFFSVWLAEKREVNGLEEADKQVYI